MKLTDNEKRDIIKLLPFLQAIEITNDWQSVDELVRFFRGFIGRRFTAYKDCT